MFEWNLLTPRIRPLQAVLCLTHRRTSLLKSRAVSYSGFASL
ncbi:hypothetical protein CEV32_4681 [Brucella rhizosphaerae]|uniref:Uncharacterized protein n=1 Tax=Brucella rhizosphaerae TaxID=571254 RepID=A0A256FKQ6_9HYPH|nr:hypothetical protein CEV32_4681 [Brucella rhizosphaerae]